MNKEKLVHHISGLFRSFGDEHYGEGMSVLSHSIQAAESTDLFELEMELVIHG